jgi:hypothetical protein
MNVEIGTETPIFLFWDYLFRNFGMLSLQCGAAATLSSIEDKECQFTWHLYSIKVNAQNMAVVKRE